MAPSSRPIVIIQTGDPVPSVLERRGTFARLIQDVIGELWRGAYEVVDVRSSTPPDPTGAAAFVITGSAANLPTREAWMLRTEAWLREVVAIGTPTFGICFGHQLLGQALGGEVRKNPKGREIGTREIERLADDPILAGLPKRFAANVTHIDSVVDLPKSAAILARSELDPHQAVRFAERCYGVQFHPEIDADVMQGYIETRRAILADEGFDVASMLQEISDAAGGKETLRNFIRHAIG
jgi:GMP synthase (glutamine-hydrolysing)